MGGNFIIPLLNIFLFRFGWVQLGAVGCGWVVVRFGSLKYELITIKKVKKLRRFITSLTSRFWSLKS